MSSGADEDFTEKVKKILSDVNQGLDIDHATGELIELFQIDEDTWRDIGLSNGWRVHDLDEKEWRQLGKHNGWVMIGPEKYKIITKLIMQICDEFSGKAPEQILFDEFHDRFNMDEKEGLELLNQLKKDKIIYEPLKGYYRVSEGWRI